MKQKITGKIILEFEGEFEIESEDIKVRGNVGTPLLMEFEPEDLILNLPRRNVRIIAIDTKDKVDINYRNRSAIVKTPIPKENINFNITVNGLTNNSKDIIANIGEQLKNLSERIVIRD